MSKQKLNRKNELSKNLTQKSKLIRKELRLTPNEWKNLEKGAKYHKQKPTVFIKKAALAYLENVFILPDEEQIKRFEARIRQISNVIYRIELREGTVSKKDFQQLQDLLNILEASLNQIFRQPPNLEDLLQQAVLDNPKLHHWILERLAKITWELDEAKKGLGNKVKK